MSGQCLSLASLFIASVVLWAPPADPDGRNSKSVRTGESAATSKDDDRIDPAPSKELFRGKVVLWKDALKKRGIAVLEEFDKLVALETDHGELIPIVPDWRGRAFYQDKRLRNRSVELVGYHRPKLATLQVLMVFTINKSLERQYTDYWCDICSIPMYEIKPCECCQAEIRIRYQKQELPKYVWQKKASIKLGDSSAKVWRILRGWAADRPKHRSVYVVKAPMNKGSIVQSPEPEEKPAGGEWDLPDGRTIALEFDKDRLTRIQENVADGSYGSLKGDFKAVRWDKKFQLVRK